MKSLISDLKSVVLTSDSPERTAEFYREVLDIPLELEQHRGTQRHWACQLGSFHFAIHDRKGFWLETAAQHRDPPGTIVSFTVDDLDRLLARLTERGVEVIARSEIGPMSFVALRDPDGRHVCCGTPWPG